MAKKTDLKRMAARPKVQGTVTPQMIAVWYLASCTNNHELRRYIATVSFYLNEEITEETNYITVTNTLSLKVTERVCEECLSMMRVLRGSCDGETYTYEGLRRCFNNTTLTKKGTVEVRNGVI